MFHYIKGELIMTEPGGAVVECGGIGYKFTVSANTIAALSSAGGEVCLYTHLYVREDAVELIGFATTEERDAFRMLITVSGVGPKAALSVLSLLTVQQFALAVSTGDTKSLSKASGVGGKTAGRIVLELKDRIAGAFGVINGEDVAEAELTEALGDDNRAEAQRALMVLGYTQREAAEALRGVDPAASLEAMITAALKKMSAHL